MRLTAITSAIFAVAGTTPNLTSISDGALSAPEPMWLALWGIALIGFSNSLRARARARHQAAPAAGTLETIRASVAQPISSRA